MWNLVEIQMLDIGPKEGPLQEARAQIRKACHMLS